MKKIFWNLALLSCLLAFGVSTLFMVRVNAEENGGAVSTKGGITLLEDTKATENTKASESSTDTTNDKPTGKYPSTGELIQKSIVISGGVLLLIAVLIYWWRHKKANQEGMNL